MSMFAISALRVEHTSLTKQLQGAFIAHHDGTGDSVQKYLKALEVKSTNQQSSEEQYAKDRARLKGLVGAKRTTK